MAIYVGGDTTELTFNFFTKVAGSMVECPMKCYYSASTSTPLPNSSSWIELNQERYDKLKAQDNNLLEFSNSTAGEKIHILIELDLTALCNSIYGGNNNTLKSNLKELSWSSWTSGEGNNNGTKSYSSIMRIYNQGTNTYGYGIANTSSAVAELNPTPITDSGYITSDNKIYIIIISDYPASTSIPNKLRLDYATIRLKINRQPDIVPPMEVELGEEWSILIKGFSPSWDNNNAPNPYPRVFEIKDKLIVSYRQDTKVFYFQDVITGTTATIPSFSFPKFKAINILITQNANGVITMYILDNGGILKKVSSPGYNITGIGQLYILQNNGVARHGDAFIDSRPEFNNNSVSDQEAEIILKSKNPNIVPNFKDNRWTIHQNATINLDGTTLKLNATANYQGSSISIPVLPNNRYKVACNFIGQGHIAILEQYNNIKIKEYRVLDYTGNYTGEFITSNNTNSIILACSNASIGVFSFNNLELRRLD
ncbi:hypothetical protein [Clostridium sp.]|uniref:hypothetical protein n=1 Tax=Clostridium sp. TaxID=1506 RepID=UPI00257D3901|nr:hypothetical protein [Clostridium sp.]MBE6058297.1 hypothetical protein [Clostridium sp.]